jgi:uncharacterized protein
MRQIREAVMTASRVAALRIVRVVLLLAAFFVSTTIALIAMAHAQQQQSAPAQQAQSTFEGRVVVIGEGSVSVAPDYAEIDGGVTTRGKSVKEATEANSKLMAAVTSALVDAGVAQKDIQTPRFSIQPLYVSPDPHGEAKLSGYNVSNQVNVTIRDIGKVGDVLDRLVAAGVTNVGNIEFLHANPLKILDQAREAAVADAKRKAEIYAKASGVTLGRVVWITEDPEYAPPMPMMAKMSAAMPAPVPISAGEDSLRVRITVGFGIGN